MYTVKNNKNKHLDYIHLKFLIIRSQWIHNQEFTIEEQTKSKTLYPNCLEAQHWIHDHGSCDQTCLSYNINDAYTACSFKFSPLTGYWINPFHAVLNSRVLCFQMLLLHWINCYHWSTLQLYAVADSSKTIIIFTSFKTVKTDSICLRPKKKNMCVYRHPTDPIFLPRPLYFLLENIKFPEIFSHSKTEPAISTLL